MSKLLALLAPLALLAASCGSFTVLSDGYERSDRLAVVSLSLDGLGASADSDAPPHIAALTQSLLDHTERLLAPKSRLVHVADLAAKFQQLDQGAAPAAMFSPSAAGQPMRNFETDRKMLTQARLSQANANRLIEALGVDAVAVVYTKWSAESRESGHILTNQGPGLQVKDTRLMPLVTTSMRIYRRGGEEVFEDTQQARPVKYLDSADIGAAIGQRAEVRDACVDAFVESLTAMRKRL